MSRRIVQCVVFIQLGLILCSGGPEKEANEHNKVKGLQLRHEEEEEQVAFYGSISTRQMDVTTPITTVPTTTTPMVNPATSNPDSPATTSSPSGSWCVATQSASQTALQVALDYACGYGGADCSAIQPGGGCYNPNTIHDHASYAFNSFYQKNPVPTSCNFGGTAITTSTDPSSGTCQYPSTSTSSSVLNTTNSSGATVFGAGPSNPSSSSGSAAHMPSTNTNNPHFLISIYLILTMMLLPRDHL